MPPAVEIVLVPESEGVVDVEEPEVMVVEPPGIVVEGMAPGSVVVDELPGVVVAVDDPGDPTTVVVDGRLEDEEARRSSVVGALASIIGAMGVSFTWLDAVATTPQAVVVTNIVTAIQARKYLEAFI